jgi:hypothetical protein
MANSPRLDRDNSGARYRDSGLALRVRLESFDGNTIRIVSPRRRDKEINAEREFRSSCEHGVVLNANLQRGEPSG